MVLQNRRHTPAVCALLLCAGALHPLYAQKPPDVSQRDSVRAVINGKKISVVYGRLSMNGRKIFGAYVPYYKVWRTGSGAATSITTEGDLDIGNAIVPRGSYTLYTLPAEGRWKLIINKQTGQWGTVYNPQFDLARTDLRVEQMKNPVEHLTFRLEKNGNGGGILKMEWETTALSVPFYVSKDSLIASPRDSAATRIRNTRLSVNYGRPSMRGRKIIGGVVPYGAVWVTGANDATSFTCSTDITLEGKRIPAGSYALYTLPSTNQWKLILNTLPVADRGKRTIDQRTGQLTAYYARKYDLARFTLKKRALSRPVEKLTISFENTGASSGVMVIAWEKTELSIPFQIP